MKHNKPKRLVNADRDITKEGYPNIPVYSTGTTPKQNRSIRKQLTFVERNMEMGVDKLKRKFLRKKKKKFTIYWAETLREKMERWVKSDISPVRLAELGVPLNMLTPDQYGIMMTHYLAQGNRV